MCKYKWLSHVLALLTVTAAVPVAAAAPANAGNGHETAGINRATGSVTTRSGQVVSGITFISEKDAPAVRSTAARQTSGTRYCLDSWRYLQAGGANAYWRPNGPFGFIWANGNRNADYWNLQFLPCFYDTWPEPNSWMFLANATGKFVDFGSIQFHAIRSPNEGEEVLTIYSKFLVCDFDAVWAFLYLYRTWPEYQGVYAYRHPSDSTMTDELAPLTGNHLFHIDPPIAESGVGNCVKP